MNQFYFSSLAIGFSMLVCAPAFAAPTCSVPGPEEFLIRPNTQVNLQYQRIQQWATRVVVCTRARPGDGWTQDFLSSDLAAHNSYVDLTHLAPRPAGYHMKIAGSFVDNGQEESLSHFDRIKHSPDYYEVKFKLHPQDAWPSTSISIKTVAH